MIRNQSNGLYNILIQRLEKIGKGYNVIPFPIVFEKLCTSFSIKKEDCFKVLLFLKDSGVIDVFFGHSVKLKKIEKIDVIEKLNTQLNTKLEV